MESEYAINAFEKNQIKLYTVLGETDSRKVIFSIIEKSGIIAATSNAVPTNKMLDLTGYDIVLNVIETGAQAAGTIISAINGKVSFVLPDSFCDSIGEYHCEIVISNDEEILRIIGIDLTVDYPVTENYDIEIEAGVTDGINLTIYNEDTVYVLTETDRLIVGVKRNVTDSEYVIKTEVTSSAKNGDGYDIMFDPAATRKLNGNYVYGVALRTANGFYPIIASAVLTIKHNNVVLKGD